MNALEGWIRGEGPVWAGGLAVGALMGWAVLTQTLVVVIVVAMVLVGWALQSRQKAALAGISLGLGLGQLLLAWRAGSQVQASTWLAVSVALVLVGIVASWLVWRAGGGPGARVTGFRTSAGIVGVALVAGLVVGWFGLPLRPGEFAVPTRQTPAWLGLGCAGVGLDADVRGDPADPRVVWLENRLAPSISESPDRLDATWPAGYRARFTPKLEVVDGWGNVVLRDGDPVTGACTTGDSVVNLSPPFK